MRGEISMPCTVFTLSSMIKGAVCWYCFDVHQDVRPWTAVYNNVQALVTFFLEYNVGIDWQDSFMCDRTG